MGGGGGGGGGGLNVHSCQADLAPEAKGIHILSGKVDFVFSVEAKKMLCKIVQLKSTKDLIWLKIIIYLSYFFALKK